MKEQEHQEWVMRQMVTAVSRETHLPYHRALECFRSTLRSIQTATRQYGPIDLSIIGVEGISTYAREQNEESAAGVAP